MYPIPMHLILIGDRVINLDRLNYAKHYIQHDHSYLCLCFDSDIITLKNEEAEQIWNRLERLCIPILVESLVL